MSRLIRQLAVGVLAAAILAVLLMSSGCSGGNSSAVPPVTVKKATTNEIEIKDMAFMPVSTTVSAGATVTWRNNDTTRHDAVADNGEFRSPPLSPGDTFSFKFDKPGTYSYFCHYHPTMKGEIIVE